MTTSCDATEAGASPSARRANNSMDRTSEPEITRHAIPNG